MQVHSRLLRWELGHEIAGAIDELMPNDKGEWYSGDMFYEFDRITRKKTRIADAVAKALVEQGKAELVRDEASMARIKFILSEEPASKAYCLARDGREWERDFNSTLKLVMEKKAKIQDIAAE